MKYKSRFQVIIIAVFFLALSFFAWFKPSTEISDSELRKLAQFPKMSAADIFSGEFMKSFESYTLDQFPLRDQFRTVKAVAYLYCFRQLDNNNIYVEDGYAAKMEYPFSEDSVNHALERFNNVYNKFIKGTDSKCYISVIPDKNYFLAGSHGSLIIDYDKMFEMVEAGTDFAKYIDITDCLEKNDFYRTDTHWNQPEITQVAGRLASSMGATLLEDYTENTSISPFYGVYYGQAALPMAPDEMKYLTNDIIDSAVVFDWQNNKSIPVYDESKMSSRAPYDLFLGGSLSLITIDNPKATTDKELVIFRDSFGSSLAPLLISGYKKVTLIDIRYLPSDRLGSFIEFSNQDVLFVYSSSVLNNSSPIK